MDADTPNGPSPENFSAISDPLNSQRHLGLEDKMPLAFSSNSASAGEQLDHEEDQGDDEDEMNQAAGDMETESKKPKDDQHDDESIEHNKRVFILSSRLAMVTGVNPEGWSSLRRNIQEPTSRNQHPGTNIQEPTSRRTAPRALLQTRSGAPGPRQNP